MLGDNVSTDYYVLETSSACCAVIGWQDRDYLPATFGTPMAGGITNIVLVEGFIRVTNNPSSNMAQNAGFADELMSSLTSDDTLQSSIDTIQRIHAFRRSNEAVSAGGETWLPMYLEVFGFEFTT